MLQIIAEVWIGYFCVGFLVLLVYLLPIFEWEVASGVLAEGIEAKTDQIIPLSNSWCVRSLLCSQLGNAVQIGGSVKKKLLIHLPTSRGVPQKGEWTKSG